MQTLHVEGSGLFPGLASPSPAGLMLDHWTTGRCGPPPPKKKVGKNDSTMNRIIALHCGRPELDP